MNSGPPLLLVRWRRGEHRESAAIEACARGRLWWRSATRWGHQVGLPQPVVAVHGPDLRVMAAFQGDAACRRMVRRRGHEDP